MQLTHPRHSRDNSIRAKLASEGYNAIRHYATTTQLELRLASRMSRLGTETAFEVLVRARALEKQGKNIIHLEIGEPDFDTPANVIEAGG